MKKCEIEAIRARFSKSPPCSGEQSPSMAPSWRWLALYREGRKEWREGMKICANLSAQICAVSVFSNKVVWRFPTCFSELSLLWETKTPPCFSPFYCRAMCLQGWFRHLAGGAGLQPLGRVEREQSFLGGAWWVAPGKRGLQVISWKL